MNQVQGGGIIYTDEMSNEFTLVRSTSYVVIAETSKRFGGVWFAAKKNSKKYAAKKAIDWLIANKRMPANGAVSFPKQDVPLVTDHTHSTSKNIQNETDTNDTFAAIVPHMAHKLGLKQPRYVYKKSSLNEPYVDAYADFDDPTIAPVGKVFGVFGKKKARDEVAKKVFVYLKDVEQTRLAVAGVKVDITDEQHEATSTEQINSHEADSKLANIDTTLEYEIDGQKCNQYVGAAASPKTSSFHCVHAQLQFEGFVNTFRLANSCYKFRLRPYD